jgi:acyl carrier protein
MSGRDVSAAAIAGWCVRYIATFNHLTLSDVDPHRTFSELGLDSANSVQMLIAVEDWIGVELNPEVLADYPTIADFAAFLAAHQR